MRYIVGFREKSIWRLCRTNFGRLQGNAKGGEKSLWVHCGGSSIGKQRDKEGDGKERSISILEEAEETACLAMPCLLKSCLFI